MKARALTPIFTLFSTALAHGFVMRWTDTNGGTTMSGWDYWKKPKTAAWNTEVPNNGYISHKNISTPDIICHLHGIPSANYFAVEAGDKIQMEWISWADSHKGPLITYIAPCRDSCAKVDKLALRWTKIEEHGFQDGRWASDVMMQREYELRNDSCDLKGGQLCSTT
jgi:cellulase